MKNDEFCRRAFGAFAVFGLAGSLVRAYDDWEIWPLQAALVFAAIWLAIWLALSSVIFFYVALSGGVMDEEDRRRYRDDETLSRLW